jgi:TonB-dependent receptor
MKPKQLLPYLGRALFACAVVLITCVASAQPAATGSIQGRVLNATNGSYVSNARITVDGSNLQAFTDASGVFQLGGVPAGSARVHVFYTGLPESVESISVQPGQTAVVDISLGGGAKSGEVIKLDAFTVASRREMDTASLAINEQRFANNIKNVVSTDAFGDIAEGNVGDFVKFLPGVTIDYVSPDARTVSVRGVAPNYTSLTLDGNPIASANSSNAGRTIELEQISLNNTSRIEVTKSRTPEQPANALGGSVNLIPRSAFEQSRPSFSYRAFLSANGDDIDFDKTAGPTNIASRKIKPGFDFVYTNPVTKNFGFTVSVLESNIFYPQHRTQPNYAPNMGTNAGATPEHPYLRQYQVQDGPKNNQRESIGATADWRITSRDVLSASFQWSYYNAFFGNRNVTYTVGNTVPRAWDQVNGTYVHGALGTGTVNLGTSFRHKYGTTYQPELKWRHTGPLWKLDAGLSFSHASNHYHDYQDDHFENMQLNLRGNPASTAINAATVDFDDLDKGSYLVPRITVLNNTGASAINLADPANYNITSGATNPADSSDAFRTVRFNARREFGFSFPFAIKAGAQLTQQTRDIRKDNPGALNFVGPDRTANTNDDRLSLYDLIDPQYSSGPYLFGTPQIPSPDPYRLWSLYKAHPEYFATPSQATLIQNTAVNSPWFEERISSAYVMADTRLLSNRLRIVGGVRFERTDDEGKGGTNNPNAARGISDPVAAAAARYVYRGLHVKKHYAAGYPSLDVSFNITPDLLVRAAYAKSIGRPDMNLIIPSVQVPDTSSSSGTITVNNVGLAPTQADAYDVRVEYYFTRTGSISLGAFEKDFSNFNGLSPAHVPTVQELALLGVPDPEQYANGVFTVSTRTNVGEAKITGVEFDYSQVLDYPWMPDWARNRFRLFANGQQMHLQGSTIADFSNFIRRSASWGVSYNPKRFTLQANFNYRGRQRLGAQSFAPGAYEYWKPRIYTDANFEYRFSTRYRFFLNARNLTNVAQDIQRYAPVVTPSWSRTYRREEFGVQYTAGIKGQF